MTDEIKLNLSQLTSSQLRQLCSIMQDVDAKSPTTNNELEEIINNMRRKEILAELLATTSKPKLGKNGRYSWRPIKGRHDIQVKAPTLEGCYEKGIDKYISLQNNFTFSEVNEMYNDSRCDISSATKLRTTQLIKEWFSPVLDKPISDITQHELKQLYVEHVVSKTGTIKRKACRNIHSVLRKIFTYANDELGQKTIDIDKVIKSFNDVNPKLFASDTPTLGGDTTKRLTRDELTKVVALCNENLSVYTCAILLAIYTGMRVSEVCALYKSDVNLDEGTINVVHAIKRDYTISSPKEYKARVVPLPDKAVNALKRAIELSPEDSPYVFYHKAPRMDLDVLTPRQLSHYLEDHVETPLGIISKSMHDIRRTYTSMLGESNIISHALRECIIGHELEGLDKYYDFDATPIPEIIKKLNIIFADF